MVKKRIIAVDDEPAALGSIRFILAASGYIVDIHSDPLDAFNQIVHNEQLNTPFSLVITDLNMPRLRGDRLIDRLRDSGIETPVLIVTGHSGSRLASSHGDAGWCGYLDKPIDEDLLRDAVSAILCGPTGA